MSEEKKKLHEEEAKSLTASEEAKHDKQAGDAAMIDQEDSLLDSSKAKIINGGARGDAYDVEIAGGADPNTFVGLTKEELQQYANDPFWIKVRWILLIVFWVTWLAMLAAAIAIIIVAPKCPHRPKMDWWQKSPVYQAYPRSFMDSDGDGNGDLKGIESKLAYIDEYLNVTNIWLNPIYASPLKDNGYDVSDYLKINSMFGTMEDFEKLKRAMHRRDMKLIMDFVPNHTSDKHKWFNASRAAKKKDDPFYDYYVWHKGKTVAGKRQPPNNWISMFGGSMWTLDPVRDEYYLHQFLPSQPDLNYRSTKVREEMLKVMRFWLDKGVDGFRVDAVAHLYEGPLDYNEPASNVPNISPKDERSLTHNLTQFQPETFELVTKWRELLDEVSKKSEKPRMMMVESYGDMNQTASLFSYNEKPGAHMPSNMLLVGGLKKPDCRAKCVHGLVNTWMAGKPQGVWDNWQLGNHDTGRVATSQTRTLVNALNALLLLLPGTPVTYYGEEIGMTDVDVSFDQTQDAAGKRAGPADYKKYSRDPARTPMQWTPGKNAGFSTGNKTWLPVGSNMAEVNVKSQQAVGAGTAMVEIYADLAKLRKRESFQWGEFQHEHSNDNLYYFTRQATGFPGFLVALNIGEKPATIDFQASMPGLVPANAKIAANTGNFLTETHAKDFQIGKEVPTSSILLRRGEGVVFEWSWAEAEKLKKAK